MQQKQGANGTYICDAGHTLALKLAAIKLLDRRSQIGSGLKLNKTVNHQVSSRKLNGIGIESSPFVGSVTARL